MKLDVYNKAAEKSGSAQFPDALRVPVRPDIIKRAVHALQSRLRQPYGAKPDAGLRASAELSRRRRKYRGSYGHGISRVPRKILSRRGTRFIWAGAVAPGTVSGRRAHGPTADKVWERKINRNERKAAIASALSATLDAGIVTARGHKVPETYPFALAGDIEGISKTKDAIALFEKLGFADELARGQTVTIRAGKGTMRGRKYKGRKGLLIVVSDNCPLKDALSNVRGIDVVRYNELNAEQLAPGAHPGRATLFTETALAKLTEAR